MTALLWLHVVGLFVMALVRGYGPPQALLAVSFIAVAALLGSQKVLGPQLRSCLVSLGLLGSSAVLVHITDGLIESHFHFFVMVAIITLYQNWVPFLVAVGFTATHHGLMGILMPTHVFNHPAAQRNPILWGLIHAGYVLAAAAANLYTWRLAEDERARTDEARSAEEEVRTARDEAVKVSKLVSEMFVNVARRNQSLLGRQVAFLDELEATEEDPDALQNLFQLDHLAAQMRRNAESLLVLAGHDATRRLRAPMPLSDVIRTAVGEIEGFHRVDLRLDANPDVAGLRALAVAHMLAELLDNATHFADPQSRVQVVSSSDGECLIVDIYDEGLGFTSQELIDANHRLASPPANEIAVAQRLGFYVVGRIAKRLNATVELKSRAAGGTVVVVTLPADLFAGGTLPVSAPVREEPATVPTLALVPAAESPVELEPADDQSMPEPVAESSTTSAPVTPATDDQTSQPVSGRGGHRTRSWKRRRRQSDAAPAVAAPATLPVADLLPPPVADPTPPVATLTPATVADPIPPVADPTPPASKNRWRRRRNRAKGATPRPVVDLTPRVVDATPRVVDATPPVVDATPPASKNRWRRRQVAAKGTPPQNAEPTTVPATAPVPAAVASVGMPLAVQDILPGRKLRRSTVALPSRPAPVAPVAPVAAVAPVVPAVPAPPVTVATPETLERRETPETQATSTAPAPQAAPVQSAQPVAAAVADRPPLIPRPRAAVVEAPASVALPAIAVPTETQPPPPAPTVPVPQTQQPALSPVANDAARNALAELSQLSASLYAPTFESAGGSASAGALASRRKSKPAAEIEPQEDLPSRPAIPPAPRSAAQVRGHLAGFRAGVERGRNEQPEPETHPGKEESS